MVWTKRLKRYQGRGQLNRRRRIEFIVGGLCGNGPSIEHLGENALYSVNGRKIGRQPRVLRGLRSCPRIAGLRWDSGWLSLRRPERIRVRRRRLRRRLLPKSDRCTQKDECHSPRDST